MNNGETARMVRLSKVDKSYSQQGGRVWVLRNIALEIRAGEFLSIMGPSGSGKTSLLNVLGMMDTEWQGEYWLGDQAVHALAPKARQALQREHVGFIFQHYHLIDDLSVQENLDLPLSYRDVKTSERKARVADILDRFHIVGKKDLYPKQLSGGQQQLVAVARAVVTRPSLLLADEPTGALHSSQGKMIMELLKELNDEGMTIVQVTHSDANARYGHRIAELQDGWLSAPAQAA
jgi:putative ABC transport system ATP-binding protein